MHENIAPEDLERFNRERRARRSFLPVTLKLRMSDEEMARFAVERWRFPGVELEPYLTRRYPYGPLFAHIIGYVGRIDEKDLAVLGEGNAALTHMGKSGLERYYEQDLRGQVGYEQVETNVQGRAIRTVGRVAPQSGADLRLSVDADLQRAMVAAFGEHEGAAIAMDPRTGEILGMVSLPSYDPNLFVNGISHTDFRMLNDNPSRPQFNRLVLGGVAPGSTLKPLIALAGLDSGLRRPEDRVLSTGMFYLPGVSRGWGDSHRGGHGWTDLRKSIAQSVNTYYYRLAVDMGIERFDHYLGEYGADLHRVMAVIVYDDRAVHLTHAGEAAAHPAEAGSSRAIDGRSPAFDAATASTDRMTRSRFSPAILRMSASVQPAAIRAAKMRG